MASKYKIGGKAILTDSDGTRDLIGVSVVYEDSFTATNTIRSLAPDYFDAYIFPSNPFQGEVSGYSSGGRAASNVIDKFPFASDANATDHGDLQYGKEQPAGNSSETHGYSSGTYSPFGNTKTIEKWSFTSNTTSSSIGNLTAHNVYTGLGIGQSTITNGFGYHSGGRGAQNTVEKFPFSSNADATDALNLSSGRENLSGQSDDGGGHGYTAGGRRGIPPVAVNIIDKFPFASDANATDVGDTSVLHDYGTGGQSSETHGYIVGGFPQNSVIDKFSFASDGNATNIGNLISGPRNDRMAGQSSFTHGYASGSGQTAPDGSNVIQKWPFSSDADATDVGDLTRSMGEMGGHQV
jgi:hypothetical protein